MKTLPLINEKAKNKANQVLSPYYEKGLIPSEKKPYLADLKNSKGPYLAMHAEDGETQYLFDSASQIASLGLGFNSPTLFGTSLFLESWTNDFRSHNFKAVHRALDNFFKRKLEWNHLKTIFCQSGAESNEKAMGLAYARRVNEKADKVLAFEGSFHGRMMISLASTWNKTKREPFEWPGYSTVYCSSPDLPDDNTNLEVTHEWRSFWSEGVWANSNLPASWKNDPQILKESESLQQVFEELKKKRIFTIIIEPMQCEGGDRYLSNRFHTGLLLLAKTAGVAVIYDEVQTGFHLGREFFWHKSLKLEDLDGQQLKPDYIVCAKKAQVGMIITPHDLKLSNQEERQEFQVASVIRGYHHGLALDQSRESIVKIEESVRALLSNYINKYADHISRPRLQGIAFAFDFANTEHLQEFIKIRFDFGLLFYPAGTNTLRFRLNIATNQKDMEFLFSQLDKIASIVFNKESDLKGPAEAPTTNRGTDVNLKCIEESVGMRLRTLEGKGTTLAQAMSDVAKLANENFNLELIQFSQQNFSQYEGQVTNLQTSNYEETRRTPIEKFRKTIESSHSICLGLFENGKLCAMGYAGPLNLYKDERGLRQLSYFDDPAMLYMLDLTVDKNRQQGGMGRFLKFAISSVATASGAKSIIGRNRDQLAGGMLKINLGLGSYEELYIEEDYPDNLPHRDVILYKKNLQWNHPQKRLDGAIESPLGHRHLDNSFVKAALPPLINKICLSNFISESFLQNLEALSSTLPQRLKQVYCASGTSECVDKISKSLWHFDKKRYRMLTFKGHYFGNGSFLSRSLSYPKKSFFPVDSVPHPKEKNEEKVLDEIKDVIKKGKTLAIWIEPIPQNLMTAVDLQFLKKLDQLASKYNVNVVYHESASQRFRYDRDHYYASNHPELNPTAGFAHLGGQTAFAFLDKEHYLDKPLMMISTWDGDEFSLQRARSIQKIIENDKEKYFQTIEAFDSKLKSELEQYDCEFTIENGSGQVKGIIPLSLQELMRKEKDRWVFQPSYSEMLDYIE